MCGGIAVFTEGTAANTGLSPRVRGNLPRARSGSRSARSIPACAGESVSRDGGAGGGGVYPRVCGGIIAAPMYCLPPAGLSPRVRGNRGLHPGHGGQYGSIPACAGESSKAHVFKRQDGVYPRVCGGIIFAGPLNPLQPGLSPRVRGNRPCAPRPPSRVRSIPACAGESQSLGACPIVCVVYPRVCGGIWTGRPGIGTVGGLSPRVRGNPNRKIPGLRLTRSIPACAGRFASTILAGFGPALFPPFQARSGNWARQIQAPQRDVRCDPRPLLWPSDSGRSCPTRRRPNSR